MEIGEWLEFVIWRRGSIIACRSYNPLDNNAINDESLTTPVF